MRLSENKSIAKYGGERGVEFFPSALSDGSFIGQNMEMSVIVGEIKDECRETDPCTAYDILSDMICSGNNIFTMVGYSEDKSSFVRRILIFGRFDYVGYGIGGDRSKLHLHAVFNTVLSNDKLELIMQRYEKYGVSMRIRRRKSHPNENEATSVVFDTIYWDGKTL